MISRLFNTVITSHNAITRDYDRLKDMIAFNITRDIYVIIAGCTVRCSTIVRPFLMIPSRAAIMSFTGVRFVRQEY